MPRRQEPLLEDLIYMHWSVSVALSVIAYVGLAVVLPQYCAGDACGLAFRPLVSTLATFAPFVALLLLIPAPLSALRARKKRRLLDQQQDLESIRRLHWKDFEALLGEYYRRRGFSVEENRQGGADGGVDLRLRDRNGLHVVQCKQWLKRPVSVSIVRELYGVMVDQGAYRGSVVTSGTFTEEAEQFAEGKPMELVDGERLERMIREVGGAKGASSHPPNTEYVESVTQCPRCGSPLVLRKARRGRHKGSEFYGCSSFPKCSYIRP